MVFAIVTPIAIAGPLLASSPCLMEPNDIHITLDETGIADWRYLNKRRPFPLVKIEGCKNIAGRIRQGQEPVEDDPNYSKDIKRDWKKKANQATIGFRNSAAGRAFVVEIHYRIPAGESPTPPDFCDAPSRGKQTCVYSAALFPSTEHRVQGEDLERILAHSPGLLNFNVRFFDGVGTPTNAVGYLLAKTGPLATPSKTTWSLSGSSSYIESPQLDSNPNDEVKERFSSSTPFSGAELSRFRGSAQLDLSQTLRDLAQADVTLRFKNGDLGEKDSTRDVEVSTYKIDIFGSTGLSLRFGMFSFASPAEKIAINESGEGFQFNFRDLSLGYINKRESLTGLADEDNDDSHVAIAQYRIRGFRLSDRVGFHGSLYASAGEDNTKDRRPYNYRTYGVELTGGWSDITLDDEEGWSIGLKGAFFNSDRDVQESFVHKPDPVDPKPLKEVSSGKGRVWLAEVSATHFGRIGNRKHRFAAHRTFSLKYGRGTGDNPKTSGLDEGYLGETASFAPDRLLLSTFAGVTEDQRNTVFPPLLSLPGLTDFTMANDPVINVIGPGLTNKKYAGFTWTEQRLAKFWNPLRGLAHLLKLKADIQSEAFIVQAHWYRFVEPVFGQRDAGEEISIEWNLEAPQGVTTKLWFARLDPGRALEKIFPDDSEVFGASISLKLK